MVLDRVVDNFFAETEQVAFCTQNIVPGIDFTNDPLLQGRNFSYLDTQLKRLGSTNFTHLPVNAPKCPMRHFQQDGHMAMHNPKGRVNYEPNSWTGDNNNPRECPEKGFASHTETVSGEKVRHRSETFNDHYSQARQFLLSQTEIEQMHMQDAFIFELSKVEHLSVRERVVSHLLNVDSDFAEKVAQGLGFKEMPAPAEAAMATRKDLPVSDALSILKNAPSCFRSRKLGVLLTDGFDAKVFETVIDALKSEGAMYEVIAPAIGGATANDGTHIRAQQKIDGGPSVLYDAVLVLTSKEGATMLSNKPEAKDFLSDAHAHQKFIGYTLEALPFIKAAGLKDAMDEGWINLDDQDAHSFVSQLSALRVWSR